jgi:hypothetical protein
MASLAAPLSRSVAPSGLAAILLPVVSGLLAYALIRQGTDVVAHEEPQLVFAWLAPVAIIAALLSFVRISALVRPARVFARGGAAFLALYFALEPFAVPYAAMPTDHPAALFHAHARWFGFALAVLGSRRLGGLFGAAMLLWMIRDLQTALTGFYFSVLDIRTAYESFAFFALGTGMAATLAARPGWRERLGLDEAMRDRAVMFVLAGAIGAHLGNYLYSGLAKLALDGGPLSWVLDNRLHAGIPGALEKGTLVTAASPALTQILYDAMAWTWLPMNLAALLLQLAAPLAVRRRRWLIWTTLGYDLFHIAVYVALGLLFWKWIALNTIIVGVMARMDEGEWDEGLKRVCWTFMIAGPAVFKIATLAWYDTPGFASPYFRAELADGRTVRVPNAWFLSSSYQVSQGQMYFPDDGRGHFDPSIWGSVLHHDQLLAGNTCRVSAAPRRASGETGTLRGIARFVALQHAKMQDRNGDYRVMPHHHMPSPLLADPWRKVDPASVRRYDFVLDSVCLTVEGGRLKRRVVKHSVWPLYAPQAGKLLQ